MPTVRIEMRDHMLTCALKRFIFEATRSVFKKGSFAYLVINLIINAREQESKRARTAREARTGSETTPQS